MVKESSRSDLKVASKVAQVLKSYIFTHFSAQWPISKLEFIPKGAAEWLCASIHETLDSIHDTA